ncbi:MAG: DUF2225 domain-containing protein [Planctomycetes bacterium]|nr:DUF2225 domain-containing protein [Planctomycetota bacterium]
MRRFTLVSAAVLFSLALGASPLLATTKKKVQLICPLDGAEVTGWEIGSTNTFGGADSDFCPYARGDQPRDFSVSSCSSCLFSGTPGEFKQTFTGEKKKQLDALLATFREQLPAEERVKIDAALGWELAAACQGALGAPSDLQAHYLSNAAWCVRDAILDRLFERMAVPFQDDSVVKKVRASLAERGFEANEEVERLYAEEYRRLCCVEMEKKQSEREGGPVQLQDLEVIQWRHRLGDAAAVDALFRRMERRPAGGEADRLGTLKAQILRERSYLDKAAQALEHHLASSAEDDPNRALAAYLAAEWRRRIGDETAAAAGMRLVLELPRVDRGLLVWAEFQAQRLGAVGRVPKEKREALLLAELARLAKDLLEPRRSGMAAVPLTDHAKAGRLRDPAILQKVLAGARHPDHDVRWFTIGVLKWVDDPSVREELMRVLREDPDRGAKWGAIEALGRVGDFSCVPLLFDFLRASRGQVEKDEHALADAIKALERFTNHALARRDYFEGNELAEHVNKWLALWEQHRAWTEEEWMKDGFAQAGCDLAALDKPAAIPRLIDAMGKHPWPCGFNANLRLQRLTGQNFDGTGEGRVEWFTWEIFKGGGEERRVIKSWEDWWKMHSAAPGEKPGAPADATGQNGGGKK